MKLQASQTTPFKPRLYGRTDDQTEVHERGYTTVCEKNEKKIMGGSLTLYYNIFFANLANQPLHTLTLKNRVCKCILHIKCTTA